MSKRYLKIVEWSDEDNCYIGRIPGLTLGGIDGKNEVRVYAELCELADEWVRIYEEDGDPFLPPRPGAITLVNSISASAKNCMNA